MTYTKRQFFIHRIQQSVNLLDKTIKYMNNVSDYVEYSKFKKEVKKIKEHIIKGRFTLLRFYHKVK